MQPLPVAIPDTPVLYASLVWGTLERLRGEVGVEWLEEQAGTKDEAHPALQ